MLCIDALHVAMLDHVPGVICAVEANKSPITEYHRGRGPPNRWVAIGRSTGSKVHPQHTRIEPFSYFRGDRRNKG
jgi:hypothetical protein